MTTTVKAAVPLRLTIGVLVSLRMVSSATDTVASSLAVVTTPLFWPVTVATFVSVSCRFSSVQV